MSSSIVDPSRRDLDDEALRALAVFDEVFPEGLHGLPIDEARRRHSALAAKGPRGPELNAVLDSYIESQGLSVPVRTYAPSNQPRPVLVWFHGGAFALGGLDTADAFCRELALAGDVVVVSVDYRLAPEHPFPAGLDDCVAVLTSVLGEPAEVGGSGPVAVGGDSAGATLAAAAVLRCRDEGWPLPAFQLLAYPTTAMRISSLEYTAAPVVPSAMANHFWSQYAARDSDLLSPYCAPLMADSLAGLSPALVIIPAVDSTRNDQLEYASRLARDGVLTTVRSYPGTPHGFFTAPSVYTRAREALEDAVWHLARHLHGRAAGASTSSRNDESTKGD